MFRVYTDEEYRKSFYKDNIPEPEFVAIYLDAICDTGIDMQEKLGKVKRLFDFSRRNVPLDDGCYRILIKSRNDNPKAGK